jgi:hypothetical protein
MQPAELPSPSLLSYAAELHSPTLLSFAVPFWTTLHLLSNAAPYCATGHSTELNLTLLSYAASYWEKCMSYAKPYRATLSPTELRWIVLIHAVLYGAYAAPCELHYSLYCATFSTCTLVQFCQIPECRTVRFRNKWTRVRYRNATVPDWDAGCWNTDADAQLWLFMIWAEITLVVVDHIFAPFCSTITYIILVFCRCGEPPGVWHSAPCWPAHWAHASWGSGPFRWVL